MTTPKLRPAILLGRAYITTILAAILTSTAFTAKAQDTNQETDQIDEIIVTGLRTPVGLDQMPTATSVIDREMIEARQSFRIVDLLRDLPGISIAQSGSVGGLAQLRMRGTEANHVLVIIDGIEANDPASGDEFQWEHLTSADIERIEVIRGPQSALWGSDAVAGVISITTIRGGDGFRGSATAEAGSFGTYRGSARVSAGGERWQFSGSAGYSESEGSNIARANNGASDEDDGYRNALFSATLGFDPSETIRLSLSARHSDTRNEFDPVDFFVTGLPTDGDRVSDTKRTYLGASANIRLMDGRLSQKLGINWIDTDNSNFADGLPDGVTAAEKLQLSAQTTYEVTKGQRLTVAVDHEITDFSQRGTIGFGDPNQDREFKTTGLVLDYVGEFDALTTFASIRHDSNSDFANADSWRLGANYAVSPATRLRASVGTGQKAPTVIERFGFFSDLFIGNPNLKPERSTDFEFGLDQDLADGRVTIKLTYFNSRLKDEINGFVFDPDTFLFTAANKPGRSKRQGVEMALEARLSREFSLTANYTYAKAEEEAAAPNGGNGSFTTELRRPKHQGATTLLYSREDGINASLNVSYTGAALDIFFPPWPNPSQIVTLDGYWLASLAGEYPLTDRLSITARVENAFNSDYEDVFGFQNPGRGIYAGLKARF